MNRRSFFALASGLLVPWEPERVYSFLPAWRLVDRWFFDNYVTGLVAVELSDEQTPDAMFFGGHAGDAYDAMTSTRYPLARSLYERRELIRERGVGVIHPSNQLDLKKPAEAFGARLVFA